MFSGGSLRWYADCSVDAALAFDAEFDRSLSTIADSPDTFPKNVVTGVISFLMKRFPFQIIYRVDGADIIVIAVAHLARNPDYWHSRYPTTAVGYTPPITNGCTEAADGWRWFQGRIMGLSPCDGLVILSGMPTAVYALTLHREAQRDEFK